MAYRLDELNNVNILKRDLKKKIGEIYTLGN